MIEEDSIDYMIEEYKSHITGYGLISEITHRKRYKVVNSHTRMHCGYIIYISSYARS